MQKSQTQNILNKNVKKIKTNTKKKKNLKCFSFKYIIPFNLLFEIIKERFEILIKSIIVD